MLPQLELVQTRQGPQPALVQIQMGLPQRVQVPPQRVQVPPRWVQLLPLPGRRWHRMLQVVIQAQRVQLLPLPGHRWYRMLQVLIQAQRVLQQVPVHQRLALVQQPQLQNHLIVS